MKRAVSLLVALLLLVMPVCFAAEPVTSTDVFVSVNGERVVFPDQKPLIQNDRTYVPVRAVTETLKAEVTWDNDTRTAYVKRNSILLAIAIGNKEMQVTTPDGVTGKVLMDVEPIIVSDRTLLPIRFVVEALGATVGWDEATRTVLITDESLLPSAPVNPSPSVPPTTQTKQVESLTLSDRDVVIDRFDTLDLIATATYSDKTTEVVTESANWRSSSSSVVSVEKGALNAKNYGTTIITATFGGKSASCNVTVEALDAGIDSIFTSSRFVSVEEESSKAITAMVNFSDGSEKDITELATWSTGDENVAIAETGNIYGVTEGSTVVTVYYEGFEQTVFVTVTPKPEDYSEEDLSTVYYTYAGNDYLVYSEGAGVFTDVREYNNLADSFDPDKAVENGTYVVMQTRFKGPLSMMAMDLSIKYNPEKVLPVAVKISPDGTAEELGMYGEKGYDKQKAMILYEEVFEDDAGITNGLKLFTLTTSLGDPLSMSTFYRMKPVILEEGEEYYAFNTYYKKVTGEPITPQDLRLCDDEGKTTLYAFDNIAICYALSENKKDKKWVPAAFSFDGIKEYEGPQAIEFVITVEGETTLALGETAVLSATATFEDGTTTMPEVTYSSSDASVAYVEGGIIFTGQPGVAMISATYWGIESSIEIIVTE